MDPTPSQIVPGWLKPAKIVGFSAASNVRGWRQRRGKPQMQKSRRAHSAPRLSELPDLPIVEHTAARLPAYSNLRGTMNAARRSNSPILLWSIGQRSTTTWEELSRKRHSVMRIVRESHQLHFGRLPFVCGFARPHTYCSELPVPANGT